VCSALAIIPTVPLFLHHYLTWPGRKVGWLSLVSQLSLFVKISFGNKGREYMFVGDEQKFPLYWTRFPARFASWPRLELSAEDILALLVLDSLPRGIPAREILNTYWCEDPTNAVFSTFFCFV